MKTVYEKPLVEVLELHTEKIANSDMEESDMVDGGLWFSSNMDDDWT